MLPSKKEAQKILSTSWLTKLDEQEISQQELIEKWLNPDQEGYEGILGYRELLKQVLKDTKEKIVTYIKDNDIEESILEYITTLPLNKRGKATIALGRFLRKEILKERLKSEREFSKKIGLSKSALNRLVKEFFSK